MIVRLKALQKANRSFFFNQNNFENFHTRWQGIPRSRPIIAKRQTVIIRDIIGFFTNSCESWNVPFKKGFKIKKEQHQQKQK